MSERGGCANTPVPQFDGLLQQRITIRRLQELLEGLPDVLLLTMLWD